MSRRAPILFTALALAACGRAVPPPEPVPVATQPSPRPAATVAVSTDWRDWPLTPGTWTYARDERGSIAKFGLVGADATFLLRCDRNARQIFLSRRASGQAASADLTIRTSSTVRALTARPTGGTPPYEAVALATSDNLLDAMGFSRGRFVVQQAGAPTLVIPAWPEILRVTEDCRG